MDPIRTIGTKLKGDEKRDAVHFAILPVIIDDEYAYAGNNVEFTVGSTEKVRTCHRHGNPGLGIIDPFLQESLRMGDRCWLFLHPNSVQGMRHEWFHPDIDDPAPISSESERWLRTFANSYGMDYDEVLEIAQGQGEDNYFCANGRDLHSRDELKDGEYELFWSHIEKITGKVFDGNHRHNIGWSCSC